MLTAALIFLTTAAFSQEKGFYYGTRVSLGESQLTGGNLQNAGGKLLWQVGGASAYQFTKNAGLTADFLVSGKGGKNQGVTEQGGITGTRKYTYNDNFSMLNADVPLCVKFSLPLGGLYLKAYGGGSASFNLGGIHTREYDDADYNQDNGFNGRQIKTLETMYFSLVYGAGIDVKAGDGRLFFLDFRAAAPLSDAGSINGERFESKYMALSAGYMFH